MARHATSAAARHRRTANTAVACMPWAKVSRAASARAGSEPPGGTPSAAAVPLAPSASRVRARESEAPAPWVDSKSSGSATNHR